MPNVELHPPLRISSFRKIAIGTWRTPYDPSVYGTIEVTMDRAMAYLARFRAVTGKRLTISHLMARAAAAALERMPDANAVLRFRRPYRRKRIGIFFQVAMDGEEGTDDEMDLSGAKLDDVNTKDLVQLIDEFTAKVELVRQRKDPALEKTRGTFRRLPSFLVHPLLRLVGWLSYTLNLDLRWAGLPKDPFGSMMITNVGSLGLDTAYVPLLHYSRVPILLALGAVKKVPVVEDDQVVVRQVMRIHATFDHRFIDGAHASVMSKVIRTWMGDPETHFGPIPETPALDAPAPEAAPESA